MFSNFRWHDAPALFSMIHTGFFASVGTLIRHGPTVNGTNALFTQTTVPNLSIASTSAT